MNGSPTDCEFVRLKSDIALILMKMLWRCKVISCLDTLVHGRTVTEGQDSISVAAAPLR